MLKIEVMLMKSDNVLSREKEKYDEIYPISLFII